jgi:hypothetical protein
MQPESHQNQFALLTRRLDAIVLKVAICAHSMHPLTAIIDAISMLNSDVMGIQNDHTNHNQDDYEQLKACNPFFIRHFKSPDNRTTQQQYFPTFAKSSR